MPRNNVKSDEDRRDHKLEFRVTKAEKEAVDSIRKLTGVSYSDLFRMHVVLAVKEITKSILKQQKEERELESKFKRNRSA